jgi:hypothetical protein
MAQSPPPAMLVDIAGAYWMTGDLKPPIRGYFFVIL